MEFSPFFECIGVNFECNRVKMEQFGLKMKLHVQRMQIVRQNQYRL